MLHTSIVLQVKTYYILNSLDIDCGRAPTIPYGQLSYTSTFLGSTIKYSCASNYKLNGDHLRVCTEDGVWSGGSPKCEGILILLQIYYYFSNIFSYFADSFHCFLFLNFRNSLHRTPLTAKCHHISNAERSILNQIPYNKCW